MASRPRDYGGVFSARLQPVPRHLLCPGTRRTSRPVIERPALSNQISRRRYGMHGRYRWNASTLTPNLVGSIGYCAHRELKGILPTTRKKHRQSSHIRQELANDHCVFSGHVLTPIGKSVGWHRGVCHLPVRLADL